MNMVWRGVSDSILPATSQPGQAVAAKKSAIGIIHCVFRFMSYLLLDEP
jgi:hypothetical protein